MSHKQEENIKLIDTNSKEKEVNDLIHCYDQCRYLNSLDSQPI